MARTTVFRYKSRDFDPLAVGRELGVDAALTGRVFQQGQTLVVQADLMRVADGSQLWGDRFDRQLADMLAIQDEIATQIAGRLRWRLTSDERELMTKRYTTSAEAYDWYLKGQYSYARLTEPDLDRSIAHYQQAIAIDPKYALAYVGLADSYARLGGVFGFRSPRETLPRGQDYAIRALSLDSKLADAHTALATYN
jgi:tetratricopeptide (TPR) repeat protein